MGIYCRWSWWSLGLHRVKTWNSNLGCCSLTRGQLKCGEQMKRKVIPDLDPHCGRNSCLTVLRKLTQFGMWWSQRDGMFSISMRHLSRQKESADSQCERSSQTDWSRSYLLYPGQQCFFIRTNGFIFRTRGCTVSKRTWQTLKNVITVTL